ncbi:MAG: FtsX-like permease family protein [Thermoanaerobaculia bacterium]|nr:FtsX-like permease family protein [Thermoanaerobaculia bacterium]
MISSFLRISLALVLRPLSREPGRTLLTVAGIGVGVAVLVSIQLANRSAIRSFEETVDAVAGRANYQLTPTAGTMSQEILFDLQPFWEEGVRFAPVIDRDGALVPFGAPVRVLGVDLLSDLHFRDYSFARVAGAGEETASGGVESWFLELFDGNSATIPSSLAGQLGLTIGDSFSINLDGTTSRFVVRGILNAEGPATAFDGSIVILDIHVAQSRFPSLAGNLSRVDLIVPDDENLTSDLRAALPPGIELHRPSRRAERVDQMLTAFRVNLFALASISLIVGIFLVYNTVLVSVLRRRGVIGTMRTLGVGSAPIFLSFLLEGLIFGILGAVAGIGIGRLLARGILDLVSRTVSTLYVRTEPSSVELSAGTILIALATGALISLFAAIQPAAEAAGVRPLSLLRESRFARIHQRRLYLLAAVGALFLGGAWFASALPPLGTISIGGYGSVLLVIAGFSLLTPAGLRLAALLLRHPMTSIFSIPGQLASASMPASLRRTAIAAAALLIAIAMMVAVSVMIGSFRDTVDAWVAQTVASDIWIRPVRTLESVPASFPPAIVEDLETIDIIEDYDPFRGREILIDEMPFILGSGDFETLIRHGRLPMIEPDSQTEALRSALTSDGAIVSESFATRLDLEAGDSLELPTPDGPVPIRIVGVYRDYSTDRGIIVIDRDFYTRLYDDDAIDTIGIYLDPGVDPESARVEIEEALASRWDAFAFTNRTIREEVLRIFDQTFVITWALLGIALTVAILGIVSTLSALIIERRREVALLRIGGMTRGEIRKMIVLEASILGITSTIFGAICGFLLSLILIFVINKQSFGWTITFAPPWDVVILSLATTFVATIAAGFLSSSLADRVDLAREIQAE